MLRSGSLACELMTPVLCIGVALARRAAIHWRHSQSNNIVALFHNPKGEKRCVVQENGWCRLRWPA
jgi:hypothetical protein